MTRKFEIHPRVGVARLGNSPTDFYLAPEQIGGLPIECDAQLAPTGPVEQFKDSVGRIKRQAAKLRIFERKEDGSLDAISLSNDDIVSITWTVQIANKKPIWYTFSELLGNLEFGEDNSYKNQHVPKNNPQIKEESSRKELIIDPGPRSICTPGDVVEFSRYSNTDYAMTWPPTDAGGEQIDSLGELRMDAEGNLIALGGLGRVTGDAEIDSFRGAGGYWDDIADGYVLATIEVSGGIKVDVEPGWLLIGSPKYAPELVNISTLDDVMLDTALRDEDLRKLLPEHDRGMYSGNSGGSDFPLPLGAKDKNVYTPLEGYNPDFRVNYAQHIKPIIERISSYRWVADIPYLADFANPSFDLSEPSDHNRSKRERFFNHFRIPLLRKDYDEYGAMENGPNTLFSGSGVPLLPLNSGDNSVTNTGPIYKFETLTPTQYFFMYQWAVGKFDIGAPPPTSLARQLDEASVGNCVGAPFSPGIETTWIVRNAPIYAQPFQLKLAHFQGKNGQLLDYYADNGLSTTADEAEGAGCEPGDLTKRMAIPWQADFQECTVQTPNITDPLINQFADGTGLEVPPAYYVYWWPPQSPMHVVTGELDPSGQVLDGITSQIDGQSIMPAGQRVPFQRAILNVQDMISYWYALGFIVNQGEEDYSYFVETERDSKTFGQITATNLWSTISKARRVAK